MKGFVVIARSRQAEGYVYSLDLGGHARSGTTNISAGITPHDAAATAVNQAITHDLRVIAPTAVLALIPSRYRYAG